MAEKQPSIPVSGMNADHPMNLKDNQYPFMLNGNIQTDISGPVTLTNEHSNILCNRFPEGYKVIGSLYVPEDAIEYLFLVNPDTNSSQIGYLSEYVLLEDSDLPIQDPCEDCGTINVEGTPLEDKVQTPTCQYTCVTAADCLNFSIDFPIRKAVIKKDNCGDSLYFTDFHNPIRDLKLTPEHTVDNSQRSVDHYTADCNGTPTDFATCEDAAQAGCTCCQPVYSDLCTSTDLNCIAIRLFPEVEHLCVVPEAVVPGGNLRSGTYQLAACYADQNGERATRTFCASNPVSVFNPTYTLTDQLDIVSGLAVKFKITHIDSSLYKFIDVFVIATINNITSVKQYSSIDITPVVNGALEYVVSDFEKGKDVTIDDVLEVFPIYEKAKEMTSGGNTLILGNLTGPRDLNLQRAVNGFSPAIRWQTSEANEWFYADGVNAANYRSYLRDELYALGIVFERKNTQDTCAYPLIGRAINTNFEASVYYEGEWIPTQNYKTENVGHGTPFDVVSFNGVFYKALTNNLDKQPDLNPSDWALYTPVLCVEDDQTVGGNDIFQEPGCRTGDTTGGPTHTKRWQVYNTACNYGQTCSPVALGIQCVDEIETILCQSYTYSVATASATWPASVGPYPANVTFTLTVDPTTLGIFNGSSILSVDHPLPAGTVINGAIVAGNTITVQVQAAITAQTTPTTISFDIDCSAVCPTSGTCNPEDCYLDMLNQCIPCEDNYPTALSGVTHCNPAWDSSENYDPGAQVLFSGHLYQAINANTGEQPDLFPADWTDLGATDAQPCPCPVWPPATDPGCNPGFVRTRTDALAYFTANGEYLLCIDSTLASYANTLADPYVVKTTTTPVKILDASNKDWYVYNIVGTGSIQSKIITTSDPTAPFQQGTKGPEDPVCLNDIFLYYPPGQPMPNWMFPSVNTPDQTPENFNPTSAINSFNPSPENKCNDYGPSAPLMYMLGNDLTAPAAHSCGCTDCDWTTDDYWNIGPAVAMVGEVNNNIYQSYWYSFTATALQPTIIIKSKIFYKYGEILGPSAPGVNMEQGDVRIDVYEGSPLLAQPTYSTGKDTVNPAKYYYDTATTENDWGVLVIGDVANSSGQPTTAGQLPLTVGQTYYVHIYLLQQAIDKVNSAPIENPNKTGNCVCYDCDTCECPDGASCCPCWLANYAWLNLCMNSATSDVTRKVSLPETWQVKCEYNLHFRHNKVIDTGCDLQTFEYGGFGYWESDTKTYPNSPEVYGDLCGKPIRHFKMPDCLVTFLQDQDPLITVDPVTGLATDDGGFNPGRKAKIYPLGIRIDPNTVQAWLDWAVLEGLITLEERVSITGYKIVRGNRVGNKSIVGKGLLYDMWKYKQYDWFTNSRSSLSTFYPSYPFNDFAADPYLNQSGNSFKHPFNGSGNNRFAFLSPETTFNSPVIGTELKMEAVNFGDALGNFYEVLYHPKYTLLSQGGIALAASLAAIQLSGDLLILLGQLLGQFNVGFSNTIPVGSIIGFVGAFLDLAPKFFTYAQTWRDIILNFGVPKNFARYYAAVGNYHSSGALGAVPNAGNKRRLIKNFTYLNAGNLTVSDEGVLNKINNYEREDSVYLFLGRQVNYNDAGLILKDPFLQDTSRFIMSSNADGRQCSMGDRQSNVASYYASIKYDVPDQYGYIHDLDWIYTGSCIDFNNPDDNVCKVVYGGDTFICRMTQKRKLPFFLDNPVGSTQQVDFQYKRISNITNATYYFNSVGESVASSSSIQFVPVEHKFDDPCGSTSGLYLDGIMYLFSYGITSFITESDFNLNYRYAENTTTKDFWPHNSDVEGWTQEYKIPIETPNAYLYNRTYSKQNKENFFCTQPVIYSNADCITTYKNRVINSISDSDSDFYTDNWRVFLGNDYEDFPLINGQLNGLDGIEREKVMIRFDKTFLVFNAYYTIDTGQGTAQIGTGNMFAQKPLEYAKTEVGYGGTSHHAFVSTQYGHFWVDAKRSAVFMLPPGDGGLQEISQSFNTFFNNNLPFFILKAFPTLDVDNNYKRFGITLGWDNKFDRLLVTKLDYELKAKWNKAVSPLQYVDFIDGEFQLCTVSIEHAAISCEPISVTDTTYFCNKSWTIGYSPITKSWISYYSFVPNYYIGHDNYFQTGINYPQDDDTGKIGIWNHLVTNKSYQVFYGDLYPFITDVVVKDQLYNKQLLSIEYQADFLRFQNDYDYFYNPRVTFNKMVIWSENRNTGLLELVPQLPNNMAQGLLYPHTNPSSTSVLVTRKNNNWRVDQFWDLVRNKYSNVPPMVYNCSPYLKDINPIAIDYNKHTFERSRLTYDYFTMRFINDEYSNYKIINKWFLNNTIKSYS